METETEKITENNGNKNLDSGEIVCLKCNDVFTVEKPAKLLHCLHTFCEPCLAVFSRTENETKSDTDENKTNGNESSEGRINIYDLNS